MAGVLCMARMKAVAPPCSAERDSDPIDCGHPAARPRRSCSLRMKSVGERIRPVAGKPVPSRQRPSREPDLLHIADLWREQAVRSFAGEDTDVPSLDFAA